MRTSSPSLALGAIGQGALATVKVITRSPSSWWTVALGAVVLVVPRALVPSATGDRGWSLSPELLISTALLGSWVSGIAILPEILERERPWFGSSAGTSGRVSRTWLSAGAGLGAGALSLPVCLGLGVLVFLVEPLGPVTAGPLMVAAICGWLGGWSLFLWMLALARHLPRGAVVITTLAILIVNLTPGCLALVPGEAVIRPLFFPVSPGWFSSDEWTRDLPVWQTLAAALVHVVSIGALLLIPGSRDRR